MIFLTTGNVSGQSIDSLNLARTEFENYRYPEASALLKPFCQAHPENHTAKWFLAQVCFSGYEWNEMKFWYEEAIRGNPDDWTLKLDFADKLSKTGNLEKSRNIFIAYLEIDSKSTHIFEQLARISFLEQNYSAAEKEINQALNLNPDDKNVQAIKKKIIEAKSVWFNQKNNVIGDDQPYSRFSTQFETGQSLNHLFDWKLGLATTVFITQSKKYFSPELNFSNKMFWYEKGFIFSTMAGLIRLPDGNVSGMTALAVGKKINRNFSIDLNSSYSPYVSTLSSLDNTPNFLNTQLGIRWENNKNWQGKLVCGYNYFINDQNYIFNFGGWFLIPPLKMNFMTISFGYGFNFSDSHESRFESIKSLNQILNSWNTTQEINGVYDPYFTPNHQQVHNAIFSFSAPFTKRMNLSGKAVYGILAQADNPYLYLSTNDEDVTIISRDFSTIYFNPLELNLNLELDFMERKSLKFEYVYMKTSYYLSHYAGVSYRKYF